MEQIVNKCLTCLNNTESYKVNGQNVIKVEGYCAECKNKEFSWFAEILKDGEIVDTMDIIATPQAATNICDGQSKYWRLRRKDA